jgi:hypothetical protein
VSFLPGGAKWLPVRLTEGQHLRTQERIVPPSPLLADQPLQNARHTPAAKDRRRPCFNARGRMRTYTDPLQVSIHAARVGPDLFPARRFPSPITRLGKRTQAICADVIYTFAGGAAGTQAARAYSTVFSSEFLSYSQNLVPAESGEDYFFGSDFGAITEVEFDTGSIIGVETASIQRCVIRRLRHRR